MQKPRDLTDEYWNRLSPKHQALYLLVRPLPTAAYTVDWMLNGLEGMLARTKVDVEGAGGTFDLIPDFQRGHVWTPEQRSYFVEGLIRKTAQAKVLFNCPGWTKASADVGDIPDHTFECIDGLQRLTTLQMYMRGEVEVFGGYTAAQLKGSPFDTRSFRLQISVYEFNWRSDLLQFYLDLNQGGTVHSEAELCRVREMAVAANIVKNNKLAARHASGCKD